MSSSASPVIEVDCRVPRWVPALPAVGLLASLLPVLIPGLGGLVMAVICSALFLILCHRVRWLRPGPRLKAVWTVESGWWLREGEGSAVAAQLRADSRIYPAGVWLRWNSPMGPRQAVLLRRGREAEAVRRLSVRLRLEGISAPLRDSALP